MMVLVAKYIGRPGNGTVLGWFGQLYDYECSVCGKVYSTKDSCRSHVYQKHRGWAHKDTEETLKNLKDKSKRGNY